MSNFNPQFSVTQARADYSGIQNAGRGIANGIAMFAQRKRKEEEEKEMEQQMQRAADFLTKAPEKYADKNTGMIDIAKMQSDPELKKLDPAFLEGINANIEQMNEFIGKKNEADTEMAAAHYQGDPNKTPVEFLNMNPASVQQGYAQGGEKALDMLNTQGIMADREADNARADANLAVSQEELALKKQKAANEGKNIYQTPDEALRAAQELVPNGSYQVYAKGGGWAFNVSQSPEREITDPNMIREIEAIMDRENLEWDAAVKRWQEMKKSSSAVPIWFGEGAGSVTGLGQ